MFLVFFTYFIFINSILYSIILSNKLFLIQYYYTLEGLTHLLYYMYYFIVIISKQFSLNYYN